MQDVEKILQKIGLSEKEVKVYLASLDLGPNSVQNIAKKSKVNRATTYVMIEWLMNKGLMTSFQKGKKQVFTAEPPENLKTLLRTQEHEIKERQALLSEVYPELKSLFALAGEKPRVKFFEGLDGIRAMREDFLRTQDKLIEEIIPFRTKEESLFTEEEKEKYIAKKNKKGIKSMTIYCAKEGQVLENDEYNKYRKVPKEKFPFESEMLIYGNKIALYSRTGSKINGVIIENKNFADSWRAIFNLAWEGAEKYQK